MTHPHSHYNPQAGVRFVNPFTPESDQCQISPPAPPEILHHTVRRTWLFIAYSDERWFWYKFSLPYLCIFSLERWENVLFELRSERVNHESNGRHKVPLPILNMSITIFEDYCHGCDWAIILNSAQIFYWLSQLSNYKCPITYKCLRND